jgi:hypothetical protein
MSVFGTGVELDTGFDLSVSEITGSLKLDSGTDVIERDVAFTLARFGSRFRGEVSNFTSEANVETAVRQVLIRDPRVTVVEDITVTLQSDPKAITVNATVITASAETDALIITIS